MVEHAQRRWPGVRFTVRYAAMQGIHSGREVIEAIGALDRDPDVDVIVVARGGGSVEDLLPFSDEAVIRAVAAITTPLVSAIGHEPDSPILDLLAADVRASTPTDAAKRVVPDVAEEAQRVLQLRESGRRSIHGLLDREAHQLAALVSRPVLADRRGGLEERLLEVGALTDRARRSLAHRLDRGEDDLAHQLARVRALSPLATLRRGYAVLSDADGQALSSVSTLEVGQDLHIRVADGRIGATTTSVDRIDLMPDHDPDDPDDLDEEDDDE